MSDLLTLRDVHHGYAQGAGILEVLRGVNLSVKQGERIALCGPSGSGKSTLLNVAGLLEQPRAGQVLIGEERVRDDQRTSLRREKIGFVFQFHHLLPEFTALENVALPLRLNGVARADADERAHDLIRQMGLADRATHLPSQLSGGEQQRVAIARAMVHNPAVLIADEPTGSLDQKLGDDIAALIFEQCTKRNMGVLLATHNEALAGRCDRLIRLANGSIQ